MVIVLSITGYSLWHNQTELAKKENLAKMMNVRIADYKYPSVFPLGYFYTTLKPGMTIEEVHSIMHGYEKVLQCGHYREVYYYYGINLDDEDTLRFEIFYSNDLKYESLLSEEPDSRSIYEGKCKAGLIGE